MSGVMMPVVVNKPIILLDNKTIAAVTLLRLFNFGKEWTIAALNHNVGLIGGRRMQCFTVQDFTNITSYLKQVYPGWFAKVMEIFTKLENGDMHKYKEVKKACVFIWCGGLRRMTFYNESLTCGQLLGIMNAIIEAACFFFGGPEHRPKAESNIAVSQAADKYTVSRWRAADGYAKYDAVFPVRSPYEGDIDIDKEALCQLTPTAPPEDVSPIIEHGRMEDLSKGLTLPWKIIDVFSSPLDGYLPMFPLRHRLPADCDIPHGARAIGELLLPICYPPPAGPLLQFNVYRYLVYGEASSEEVSFLSEQLTALSEQHRALASYLYALSNQIFVSEKQLSCLTMHFTYMSKSTLYQNVWDLYNRSCDIHQKLVDPSPPLEKKTLQLNRFWIQYQRVSEQFKAVRRKFGQPFPEHECDACGPRGEFPKFPSPYSYEELLGCGKRGLPMPTGSFDGSVPGYCLTAEQLEMLITSMSSDPHSRKAEAVAEEHFDTAPATTTKDSHSLEGADTQFEHADMASTGSTIAPGPLMAGTRFDEQVDIAPTDTTRDPDPQQVNTQFQKQVDMAPTSIARDSGPRQVGTQFEEQIDMAPTSTTIDPDLLEAASQFEEQSDKPDTSMTTTHDSDPDQDILDFFEGLPPGDDLFEALERPDMERGGPSGCYPEPPPGYTFVAGSATVSYERGDHKRTDAPDTARKRPAKRRKTGEGSSTAGT
ncbi:hypothetical protein MMC30_004867 [Trapelia coarctata]|nr:hypothetical protein [Trapelia coarctata]